MTQRNKLSSRLLSLILAMLMIVSMIPATVFAAPASDIPIVITLMVLVLFHFIFMLGYVPTESMEPTLKTGSLILGLRLFDKLETDDIIIFRRNGSFLVKRIAACPGDTIVHQNTIMTVPENSYYVLGDNAEYSDDSRYWEDPFVSHEDVIAKLFLPESEERNSGILCASLVGDAHKERSSGLNCTGRPFFSFGGAVTDG